MPIQVLKVQKTTILPSKKKAPEPVYFRTFICTEDNHYKFYEITLTPQSVGYEVTCRWGKIGTSGQTKTEQFTFEDDAKRFANRKAGEKIGKGYTETTDNPEQYQELKRTWEEAPDSQEKFDLFLSLLK